jgi:hypothetical protein
MKRVNRTGVRGLMFGRRQQDKRLAGHHRKAAHTSLWFGEGRHLGAFTDRGKDYFVTKGETMKGLQITARTLHRPPQRGHFQTVDSENAPQKPRRFPFRQRK